MVRESAQPVKSADSVLGISGTLHNASRLGWSSRCASRNKIQSETIMKKTSSSRQPRHGGMRQGYRFDYAKSRPNRFAPLIKSGSVAIVLDPDAASVFQSPQSINSPLRSLIKAFPKNAKA